MGTLALANMVPQIEPDSQWTTALHSHLFFSFFCLSLCQQAFSDSFGFTLTCFGRLRTDLRDVPCQEASSQTD